MDGDDIVNIKITRKAATVLWYDLKDNKYWNNENGEIVKELEKIIFDEQEK